jgi:hypothetical protein
MFPISGIREHISSKLDEIGILQKLQVKGLLIEETEQDDRKRKDSKEPLLKIKLQNIPITNSWVFHNEFSKLGGTKGERSEKAAFESAGKKGRENNFISCQSYFILCNDRDEV